MAAVFSALPHSNVRKFDSNRQLFHDEHFLNDVQPLLKNGINCLVTCFRNKNICQFHAFMTKMNLKIGQEVASINLRTALNAMTNMSVVG